MSKSKFGTREWAEHNHNIIRGCKHDCRYCFAKYNACRRWKQIPEDKWTEMKFINKKLNQKPRFYRDGRIMFPTRHDILPEHIPETIEYLDKWFAVGNEILITTKPHIEVVKAICEDLGKYKDKMVFRFTVGSLNQDVLDFWEPNAPSFGERLKSIDFAFDNGFQTSVSGEPYLDADISLLVNKLLQRVSDTIWIGKMNYIDSRVGTREELVAKGWTSKDFAYLDDVEKCQTDEFIWDLYAEFKDKSKVRWKESCKKVLGLPDEVGVA